VVVSLALSNVLTLAVGLVRDVTEVKGRGPNFMSTGAASRFHSYHNPAPVLPPRESQVSTAAILPSLAYCRDCVLAYLYQANKVC
ncbi:hypothetical protein GE21DRAFT_1346686, partial [Neurospora crassa]